MNGPLDPSDAQAHGLGRTYRPHAQLDHAADLVDAGDYAAYSKLPPAVQARAADHAAVRAAYRKAVDRGLLPTLD